MEISYTSKLFSLRHSLDYKLSIQANLNGFSFCVYDFTRETFLLLKHFPIDVNNNQEYFIKQLSEIIKNEEVFSHKFRQVNFVYNTPNVTVIPDEFLDVSNLKTFLQFQNELHDFDELHYDTISQIKSTVVYPIPSAITNTFLNTFKGISYTNQYTLLLSLAQDLITRDNLSDLCFIHKSETFFDIIIFKNKKLELCNSFSYKTENDLVYYCISTLKYLGLSESNIPVFYSGFLQQRGTDTHMLDKFIKVFKQNEPLHIKKANNLELFNIHPVYYFTPLYFVNY